MLQLPLIPLSLFLACDEYILKLCFLRYTSQPQCVFVVWESAQGCAVGLTPLCIYCDVCVCAFTASFWIFSVFLARARVHTRVAKYTNRGHLFISARHFKLLPYSIFGNKRAHFEQRKKLSPTILARQCR